MKAVVIIPTYNEKGNIEKLIEVLEKEIFPDIKNYEMGILVADDNSPDGTGEIVKDLMKKWKNLELITGKKEGLGAAYVRGMDHAISNMKADVVFEMDADFFHDPKKIPEFLKKIDDGHDFVVGTRYSNGGSIPANWGMHRKFLSIVGNFVIRSILMRFYIHDWTGGYRAIKKEVFLKEREKIKKFKGYTFQVGFLLSAVEDGFKIAEIPFSATDRVAGRSKIPAGQTIFQTLSFVIVARMIELVHSPFLKYAITGFVGYLINAISLEVLSQAFSFHPLPAAAIAAEFSIVWNFIVNNFWAFGNQKITSPWKVLIKFPQFNLVSLGSLVLITSTVFVGTHLFGNTTMARQVSLVIAIVLFVIPYSYSMYNIFIWKRWHIASLSKLQKKLG
ncbi:MAG: glycosyltransferase family 2 protein [Candidatus Levybacteria bacterium]|nr:glycosyltransferase family 2 protein [Candidatus Levybacteria bacterium]